MSTKTSPLLVKVKTELPSDEIKVIIDILLISPTFGRYFEIKSLCFIRRFNILISTLHTNVFE